MILVGKLIAATLTVIVTIGAIYSYAIVPFEQNELKSRVEASLRARGLDRRSSTPTPGELQRSHEELAQLLRALQYSPTDLDLLVEIAAEYRFLDRLPEAAAMYERALLYDRRPEIYGGLADVQLQAGHVREAVDSYAHAAAFYPPHYLAAPESLWPDIKQRVADLYGPTVAAEIP